MVEHYLAKVNMRVRFPSPAPIENLAHDVGIFLFPSINSSSYHNVMIDLHVHLDGSLNRQILKKLCELNHRDPREVDNAHISVSNQGTLEDYLECFAFPCSLIQTAESITYAFYAFFVELHRQGHLYAEVRFAPAKSCDNGLEQVQVVQAAIQGLEIAKQETRMPGNIILCCMRSFPDEVNMETVHIAKRFLGRGVCGIDLAGPEVGFSNEMYAPIMAEARNLDIPITIHAGENLGPENIWAAIRLGAKRIGHGIRAVEDPLLLAFLAQTKIPLEICPTSERDTHCIPSLEALPIRKMMKAGCVLTLGSDDQTVSNTTLSHEMDLLRSIHGLTEEELDELERNSIDASFLEPDQKEYLFELYRKEKEQGN